ncbi:MAG: DUF2924 domain-containing protein [Betaproteobacteria bacterium]
MPTPTPPAVLRRIAALPKLPIADLRALFAETFGHDPVVANRRFLERRLAYHWQATAYERQHPGALQRQRERIEALAAALDGANKPRPWALAPGTVLVRAFDGVEHEVRVGEGPVFDYAGQRFGSLSEVARAITGTRWSGPKFFGLTARSGLNRS